ncbi:ATP synthase subunit I [Spiribacter pallidus]|jgi:ATP synthase protein I|uniref:ATP synthase subunit I n=1 Tax=Spiribacter pallidus TaxID=1987936 RepID=A0ABV3TCZ5_9GAMM
MSLKKAASRVIRLQAAIGVASAALWVVVGGVQAGLAAIAGAGISVFMTFFVAVRWSLRSAGEREPRAILGAFYRTQTMKLLLGTALIFVAVRAFDDHAAALVITLALTLAAYGLVLLGDID